MPHIPFISSDNLRVCSAAQRIPWSINTIDRRTAVGYLITVNTAIHCCTAQLSGTLINLLTDKSRNHCSSECSHLCWKRWGRKCSRMTRHSKNQTAQVLLVENLAKSPFRLAPGLTLLILRILLSFFCFVLRIIRSGSCWLLYYLFQPLKDSAKINQNNVSCKYF